MMEHLQKRYYATHLVKAVMALTDVGCNIDGEIETEEDWNNNVKWVAGKDEKNKAIWTYDAPAGITYATVKAKQAELEAEYDAQDYSRKRAAAYPSIYDYMDGIVKNDQAQIDKYIADSQAVKAKYPKP